MIRIQTEDFDAARETDALTGGRGDIGALVTFTGLVRGKPGHVMELEHYPAMASKELEEIEREARRRWPLEDCLIIHRHGTLRAGERIVFVATASTHRTAAFEAAEFLMDYLKTRAPFWKRETTEKGTRWIDAAAKDDEAASRWREP